MSLRGNSLREHIRDLAVRPDGADADEQARRGSVGREVLQALEEIDRIARGTTDATGAPGGAAAGATPMHSTLSLAGRSFAFPGTVYGATPVCGATAPNTARLIGSATSVRLTGRQARRA